MKGTLWVLISICCWLSLFSCGSNVIAPASNDVAAKIDSEDRPIKIEPEQKSCLVDEDCVIIDEGCCRGEKRIAVNKEKSYALVNSKRQECLDLKSQKKQEIQKNRDEIKGLVQELREERKKVKELDKAKIQELTKQLREKQREKKHELCYGREGLSAGGGASAQCIECLCVMGGASNSPASIGPKCIEAHKYLSDKRPEILKALAKQGNDLEKKNGITQWNKLIVVIKKHQECACEKYLKDLQETMNRLVPPEPELGGDKDKESKEEPVKK